MVEFRFYINDEEVEEPKNWSDVEFQVTRDSIYFGLERIASLKKVVLWGRGLEIVEELFSTYGVKAEASFRIERLDYDVLKYQVFAPNEINFETYIEDYTPTNGDTLEVELIDSNVNSKVANRENNELIVGYPTTIDGNNTSILSRSNLDVIFKSRGIKHVTQMKMSGGFTGIPNTANPNNTFREMKHSVLKTESIDGNIPFLQNSVSEGPLDISELNNPPQFSGFEIMSIYQLALLETAEDYNIELDYSFRATISTSFSMTGSQTFNNLRFRIYECDYNGTDFTNPVSVKTNTFSVNVNGGFAGGSGFVDVSDTFTLNKKSGKVYFLSVDALGQNWGLGFFGEIEGNLSLDYETYIEDSAHNSVFIYPAVLSLLEQITDVPGILYSEALGRPEDGYNNYGEFSKIILTNGLFLRNAINSDGSDIVITANFKDLYTTLTNILGLAMWRNRTTGLIHIEKRNEAFSGNEEEITLENVKITLANEFLLTSVKVGNTPIKYEDVNGANEFNMTMDFNTSLNVKSNTLKLVTAYNTDYLGVERARMVPFSSTANIDTKFDDKNFIVEVEELNGNWQTKMGSTYPLVSGIPLPETAGNILFTPKRSLIRNSDLISPSYWKMINEELVFTKAGNLAALTSKDTSSGPFIVERDNLSADEMEKLFIPMYAQGDVPKRDIWKLFLNQNVVFKFELNRKTIYGFVWSAKIKQEVANIKLLLRWDI